MRKTTGGLSRQAAFVITFFLIIGISFSGLSLLGRTRVTYADEVNLSIPCLVDLGAGKCIPCKQMKPILDELEREYDGRFDVLFYDVWEDPEPAEKYGIHAIPTQIFLDEEGRELFRHVGFFSKEDILNTWEGLGYDFD
jgi:thioredoxin 1